MSETSAIRSDVSSRSAKKRAKVWEHIETEIIDGREHSSCKYCKTKLSTEPGKGTNHLNRHIALYCHNIPAEDRDRFLLTWKPHNSAIVPHVFEPHVFRLLIAKFFVSAEIAFRKADDPHWKNMINYCQPSFRVVGRQTTASDCIELYEEEKKQLQIFVEKQASHVHTVGANVDDKMNDLCIHLRKYYLEYEKIVRSRSLPTIVQLEEQHTTEPSSSSPSVARFGKRRIELAFAQFTSDNAGANAQLSELDASLKNPRVYNNPEEQFDVLGWWKRNAEIFPTLSLMARDFLAIPVSTVSSESAFSCAGRLLGKDRTSLTPETLEALICCKDWIVGFSEEDEGPSLDGCRTCDLEEYN